MFEYILNMTTINYCSLWHNITDQHTIYKYSQILKIRFYKKYLKMSDIYSRNFTLFLNLLDKLIAE